MKTSTFAVLSFVGLICLASSIVWFPLPRQEGSVSGSGSGSEALVPEKDSAAPAAANVEKPSGATTPDAAATDSEPAASVSETQAATAPVAPVARLKFPDWPRPEAAIVVTGEQHGYFEPCGCTANQLGGMSRRANLFAQLESLGWTVRGIEIGGMSRRTGLQAQMKLETTLAALRELKYVAMGLGIDELRLGPEYLLAQHLTDGDIPLKFLGANLVFFGARDLGTPLPHAVVDVGKVRLGITSVMSDSIRRALIPEMTAEEAASADLSFMDPTAALQEVMATFDSEGVTHRVVISHATLDESRQLARDFPAIDVIAAAEGFGDGEPQPELIGTVRMLQVGEKGRAAGVLGIYPDDPESPVRFELVTLNDRIKDESPAITRLMQRYQDRLKQEAVAVSTDAVTHPSGATFVGAQKCGECHTQALEIWKATPHAHALESLNPANGRKGHERLHGVDRSYDPECIACHVTGWNPQEYVRFTSGFVNVEFAATDDEKLLQSLLGGNQCENCHGPGSRHVELIESGDTAGAAKEVRVPLAQADASCRVCHDLDNSPNFSFDEYWDQVKHYGKD